jgi:hypothetical protein
MNENKSAEKKKRGEESVAFDGHAVYLFWHSDPKSTS